MAFFIGRLGKTYRHFRRYQEIIIILIKYGFTDLVSRLHIHKHLGVSKKSLTTGKKKRVSELTTQERIRLALTEMGTTFIKLGQLLSNRPDLLPPEIIHELEKLQSNVEPCPLEDITGVIEEELHIKIDDYFRDFDHTPLGSASIAQVHRAKLKGGEEVVVKVQRPGIKKQIDTDIEILLHLSSLVENNLPEYSFLNPLGIVREFKKTIQKELDFSMELHNIERFSVNFRRDERVAAPKIYQKGHSRKVIIMEYIDGLRITDVERLKEQGIEPGEIAGKGADIILKQIFVHGFFHADPHPGNVFVQKNGRICFLDFGMMGFIIPRHLEALGDIVIGFVNDDFGMVARTILNLSSNNPDLNTEHFEAEISDLIQQFNYLPVKEIDIREVIHKSLQIIFEFKLHLPPSFFLLLRCVLTLDGIARKIEPGFNLMNHLKPYAKKILMERVNPLKLTKSGYFSLLEMLKLAKEFPFEARDLIRQLKLGKITIAYEHKGLEPMLKKHDQISNRLSLAILLAALIIGSSLIAMSNIPPHWHDIPVLGVIGFVTAGIIGFWLLISIMRSGKF